MDCDRDNLDASGAIGLEYPCEHRTWLPLCPSASNHNLKVAESNILPSLGLQTTAPRRMGLSRFCFHHLQKLLVVCSALQAHCRLAMELCGGVSFLPFCLLRSGRFATFTLVTDERHALWLPSWKVAYGSVDTLTLNICVEAWDWIIAKKAQQTQCTLQAMASDCACQLCSAMMSSYAMGLLKTLRTIDRSIVQTQT